jgi:hypothetical protein
VWGAVPNHSVRTNPIASSSKDPLLDATPFTPVASAAGRKRSSPSPDDEDTMGVASSSTGRGSFQGDRPKRVRKNVKYVVQDEDSDGDSVVTDAGDEEGEEEFKVGGKEDEVVSDDGNATDGMVDED